MIDIGDYVLWYEEYADGAMCKDYGDGIVIEKKQYNMYKPSITCYKIYRVKHEDFMWLEERNISLKGKDVTF